MILNIRPVWHANYFFLGETVFFKQLFLLSAQS